MAGWPDLVVDQILRVQRDLESTLDGLDPALRDRALRPGTNTIGWLAWHLTRSHDRNVSELRGAPQLWITERWYERFGRAPDPGETGFGHTPVELAAFRSPSPGELIAYHAAVVDMVLGYLRGTPDDLTRIANSPTLGDARTVQSRLVGVLAEGMQHVGQMAYLRGLLATP